MLPDVHASFAPPSLISSRCRRLLSHRQVSGDLLSLTDDLAHVVASLPRPPVLVAHSFGALLAEKYMTGGWAGGWWSWGWVLDLVVLAR